MTFEVWAPIPEKVELWLDGEVRAMERSDDGWWSTDVQAEGGSRYGFLLDGEGPYPDPRSRCQPEGIDRPSEVLAPLPTPASFTPPDPKDWVSYELHIGTFTPEGTYAAAIGRLDHLVDLGINVVDVMPVNTFSGPHGWGYDGVNLYAPHQSYGSPEDLAAFVDACHERGLACVLDVVYNHFGPAGNHLPKFGPYFTDHYSTPWGQAVNFDDGGADEVRRYFIDNALMWLEDYGFDGLRLDAVHAIFDRSAVHFLEELATAVDIRAPEAGRRWYLIAESDLNDPRLMTGRDRGGYGLYGQWLDDLHHALHAVMTGETGGYYADFGRLGDLAKGLTDAYVYDGTRSRYRGRRHGRPATGIDGDRFVTYMQNHDQVGNRAVGDRIAETAGADMQKIGAALILTSPFVPMLFMGEEWAASSRFPYFTSHQDPDLGRAVSEGRTSEFASFGWDASQIPDPQDPETFASAKLRWDELGAPEHAEMLEWYRQLISLRRSDEELRAGHRSEIAVEVNEEAGTLTMRRGGYAIACNLSETEQQIDVEGEIVLSSKKQRSPQTLEPVSVSILSVPRTT